MQGMFTKGMEEWFKRNQFQVGIPARGIDQKKWNFRDFNTRFKDYEKLAGTIWGVAGALKVAERFRKFGPQVGKLGGAIGAVSGVLMLSDFLIDTGATVDDLYNALKPYASRADLFGLKISDAAVPSTLRDHPRNKTFWNTVLIPVIYADNLTPDSITQRFDKFVEAAPALKRLGLRAKLIGNRASIYPLLVYFDSHRFEEDKGSLWPEISKEAGAESTKSRIPRIKAVRTPELKAKLSVGMVNVSDNRVLSEIFDEDDLYHVLKWGQSEDSSSN